MRICLTAYLRGASARGSMAYIPDVDERVSRLRAYWTRTGSRLQVTEIVRPAIASLGGRVLDVGGGREAAHDDSWHPATTRIRVDISSRHRPDVVADATSLPFPDATLDGAVMVETLEHLASPWLAIDEIHRVLRPGGTFFGTVAFVYPVHGDPHDYFRYGADGLRHLLRRFDQVEIEPHGNTYGAVWNLLTIHSKGWRVLNPLLRRAGKKADPRCPQGYAFTATR